MVMVQNDNLITESSACRVNGPWCQEMLHSFPPTYACQSTLTILNKNCQRWALKKRHIDRLRNTTVMSLCKTQRISLR